MPLYKSVIGYLKKIGGTITGGLTVQPTADTLTGLVVNDKDANNVLTVDTINNSVGIGTTVPGVALDVQSNVNGAINSTTYVDSPVGGSLGFRKARGTQASPVAVQANDYLGGLFGQGYTSAGSFGGNVAAIILQASQAYTSSNQGSCMSFLTAADNSNTRSEAMRILGSGKVGIGTPSPSSVLDVVGTVQFASFGAGAATFDASGNISSVSDERMKNIQGDFTAGLKEILQINPILYKYNEASGLEMENTYAGFSAQNVMKYIPEAVGKNLEGFYSFNDRPVIAALVNSIKELQIEIVELKIKASLPTKDFSVTAIKNEERCIISKTEVVKQAPAIESVELLKKHNLAKSSRVPKKQFRDML